MRKLLIHKFCLYASCFILIGMICSCEELLDVDVKDIESSIVIDGIISDDAARSRVIVSYTQNIYQQDAPKYGIGAKVTLSDGSGNIETLKESLPGRFEPQIIKGIPGKTYSLQVEYKGNSYNALTKMNPSLSIDSIKFVKQSGTILGITIKTYYQMICYITNRSKEEEYGMITVNDGSSIYKKMSVTYNGKYLNGASTIVDYITTEYNLNAKINVDICSLDKNSYDYFYQLTSLANNDELNVPDVFKMTSYNPKSNLNNKALGYFSARAYKRYVVTVK